MTTAMFCYFFNIKVVWGSTVKESSSMTAAQVSAQAYKVLQSTTQYYKVLHSTVCECQA
jgi:hypothetical protein